MAHSDLDPKDVANAAAIGAAASRRRGGDDDDDDGDETPPGRLWGTALMVIGALVVMLALVLTFAG